MSYGLIRIYHSHGTRRDDDAFALSLFALIVIIFSFLSPKGVYKIWSLRLILGLGDLRAYHFIFYFIQL